MVKVNFRDGIVKVRPDVPTDLYVLKNVIFPGDLVKARTSRRVRKKDEEKAGDKGERISMTLQLEVEAVDFHEFTRRLRIKGKIKQGPEEYVALGSYHTFNIGKNDLLTIQKEKWPRFLLEKLEKAKKAGILPKIAILAIDRGSAAIGILDNYRLELHIELDRHIPGKYFSNTREHDIVLREFFGEVTSALQEIERTFKPGLLLIGGPGFVKENYLNFLKEKSIELAQNTQLIGASSGGAAGVNEISRRDELQKLAQEYAIIQETQLLEELLARIGRDEHKVAYSVGHVEQAAQMGAIETLMLNDRLLTIRADEERTRVNAIIKKVEGSGGKVVIFDSLQEPGKRLHAFGDIAALLRYAVWLDN
ncbi:MAG: mRNA surveillance protein pelota [Candidatus Heimdallarchaeota archaeon]